jgi:integrase
MVDRVSIDPADPLNVGEPMSASSLAPVGRGSSQLPRRRPVSRHPGIYYRPRADGKVAPPYEIVYLDSDGNRRWQVVHGNLDEAEAKRSELRLRRRRGEQIRPSRQTFAEEAAAWLERQTVKPRTIEIYSWALRCHLIPYFGRRRLDQITPDDIAAFITHMRQKNLKGWTIKSALRPLSIMLAQAARKGRIPANPMQQLERGERPNHDDQRPKRILTLDEMQRLLAACDALQARCLFELLLASGLRIGEALGLTVSDLDLEYSLIRVAYQLDREGTRAPLKTPESQRTLDIPPRLMRRLCALLAARGDLHDPHALVFASRTGAGLERKVVRSQLNRATKTAKLTLPHPTLHDLRHSHASMLIALNYTVTDVQHRLGHRKPDTTLRIYVHQWRTQQAKQSTIGTHIGPLLSPTSQQLANRRRKQLALPAGEPT